MKPALRINAKDIGSWGTSDRGDLGAWVRRQPEPLRTDCWRLDMLDEGGCAFDVWHFVRDAASGRLVVAGDMLATSTTRLTVDEPFPAHLLHHFHPILEVGATRVA